MSNKQEETIDNLPDALAEIARLEGSMETMRDRIALGNSTEVEMSLLIMPAHLKAKTIRTLECAAEAMAIAANWGAVDTPCHPDPSWGLDGEAEDDGDDADWANSNALCDHLRAVAEEVRRS